jgi:cell wall-associated NlpC family hydrolase
MDIQAVLPGHGAFATAAVQGIPAAANPDTASKRIRAGRYTDVDLNQATSQLMPATGCLYYLFVWISLGLAALVTAGCASSPAAPAGAIPASITAVATHPGVRIATAMLGAPYHYGGSGPRGFDCSGLVYYAFRETGIRVPRTTGAQLRHARPVPLSQLLPGDLLFFRLHSSRVSHVGIYVGDGWFIHAPSRGKRVSYASMQNSYWKSRLVTAGRYY